MKSNTHSSQHKEKNHSDKNDLKNGKRTVSTGDSIQDVEKKTTSHKPSNCANRQASPAGTVTGADGVEIEVSRQSPIRVVNSPSQLSRYHTAITCEIVQAADEDTIHPLSEHVFEFLDASECHYCQAEWEEDKEHPNTRKDSTATTHTKIDDLDPESVAPTHFDTEQVTEDTGSKTRFKSVGGGDDGE